AGLRPEPSGTSEQLMCSVLLFFFHPFTVLKGDTYSDSRLGVRFVIEGIESTRSVFKAITATRNAARPIQFSQRKARSEIAMGEIGLKARLSGRNPVARRYWPERTARHITSKPEAQTTISSSNGSLVTGSSNNARSTIAIETHIMIFVSIETSSFFVARFVVQAPDAGYQRSIAPEGSRCWIKFSRWLRDVHKPFRSVRPLG